MLACRLIVASENGNTRRLDWVPGIPQLHQRDESIDDYLWIFITVDHIALDSMLMVNNLEVDSATLDTMPDVGLRTE